MKAKIVSGSGPRPNPCRLFSSGAEDCAELTLARARIGGASLTAIGAFENSVSP